MQTSWTLLTLPSDFHGNESRSSIVLEIFSILSCEPHCQISFKNILTLFVDSISLRFYELENSGFCYPLVHLETVFYLQRNLVMKTWKTLFLSLQDWISTFPYLYAQSKTSVQSLIQNCQQNNTVNTVIPQKVEHEAKKIKLILRKMLNLI